MVRMIRRPNSRIKQKYNLKKCSHYLPLIFVLFWLVLEFFHQIFVMPADVGHDPFLVQKPTRQIDRVRPSKSWKGHMILFKHALVLQMTLELFPCNSYNIACSSE